MPFEARPDGSLRLPMHQPVYQVAIVMAAFFGFGIFFLYSAAWSEASEVVIKGFETGYALPVWAWRLLFVGLGLVMTGAGVFILLGLLRGNKPYVRIEKRRIVVGGFAVVADRTMRWDEIAQTSRSRIMGGETMMLKAKSGRKLQLAEHTFRDRSDFRALCSEIEERVELAR